MSLLIFGLWWHKEKKITVSIRYTCLSQTALQYGCLLGWVVDCLPIIVYGWLAGLVNVPFVSTG